MDLWFADLPYGLVILGTTLLVVALSLAWIFLMKPNSSGLKKMQANRVLLKQLLESFGLEVPTELEEPEGVVVKSGKQS